MKTRPAKLLEHGIKRLIFAMARIILKKGRADFATIDPGSIKRVLFLRPDKLGDMIVSLPVFHNLKKRYPHLELYTISSPRNIAVVRHDENIAYNFVFAKRPLRDLRMLKQVRQLNVDAVVDMVCHDSMTAMLLSQNCSPGAWRIGIGKRRYRGYYDFNYELPIGNEAHAIDNTLKLLIAFGFDADTVEKFVPPAIGEASYRAADRFIASLNGTMPGGIIGINISAGRPTRIWPEDKTAELVRRLLGAYPACRIVISADPREHARAEEMARKFESRVAALPPGLGLLDVAAIISRMRMLVTPDTSLVHIARSFRVPVVGLYTRFQSNFRLWRPYGQTDGTIRSGNDYNIHDIEVDDVFRAITAILPSRERS